MRARCFLAVPVEEPARAAATELIAALRSESAGIRFVRPEGLHLTLQFLGSVDRLALHPMLDLVRPVAGTTQGFPLTLQGLGWFPGRGTFRTLWLGAGDGTRPLRDLAARSRELLKDGGMTVDELPFAAHCTLGRVDGPAATDAAAAWRTRKVRLPAFVVRRIVLMESVPAPGGAVYTPRGELALGV